MSTDNKQSLPALTLAAIGVVYGDIGTSPLYTLRECLSGQFGFGVERDAVFGFLSLIFWLLIFTVSIKYITFVMRADNAGEGGILTLMSLAGRNTSARMTSVLVILGLIGGSFFYGEVVITPAISVMSAIEGLEIIAPQLDTWIVPISIIVLTLLFVIQKHGTGMVGKLFAPIMLIWFLLLAVLGALAHVGRGLCGGRGGSGRLLRVLAQEAGQLHARHVAHLVHGRDGLHQAGDKARRGGLAILLLAAVPDGDLVDLDALDGVHLDAHELLHLVGQHQVHGVVGVAARGGHDLPPAVGLLDQALLGALGRGLHLGQDGVGLALGAAADLLGLGRGLQLPAALVDLGLDDDVGLLGGLLTLGAGGLGLLLGGVGLLQGLGRGDLLGGGGDAGGLGLLLAALGVGHGHLHLGGVLALDGGGVGLGHLDALVAAGLGLANGAVAVLLGHVLLGVVDGLGGGLLAQGVNVAGLVGDVGDVDVDEAHRRSVGVLRLKDERGAKLCLAHGHAALLEQPRQRRHYGDKNESNDGAPHKEGSHGATSLLIEVNY